MPLMTGLPLLSALVVQTEAHGSMTNPVIRGLTKPVWPDTFVDKYAYEPQTLGATGGGAQIPICGRLDANVSNRRPFDPVTSIVPGQPFTFTAHVKAHHMGHMTVRLCPLIDASWVSADLAQCVALNATGDTSNQAQFWWLGAIGTPQGTFPTWTADIPALSDDNFPVSVSGGYTIQWRYNTANSCCPQRQAYPCRPDMAECHSECLAHQANSCVDGDIQTYGNDGTCDDEVCCSEVFTNCADVVFEGVAYDEAVMNVAAVSAGDATGATGAPSSGGSHSGGSTGGGQTSSSSQCVGKGPWAGTPDIDAWCATNKVCGTDDEGENCDCRCSGDTASEPEPIITHSVNVVSETFVGWDMAGLQQFCNANKAKYCAEDTLVSPLSQICSCTPAPAPPPTPPAADSEPESASESATAPVADSEPESASETATATGSATGSATATEVVGGCPATSLPDSCTNNQCSLTCQALCNGQHGGVATNQKWGDPRYIHCKCTDGAQPPTYTEYKFAGCECRNDGCPTSVKVALAQINFGKQATKVSRHLVQEHRILDVDAQGRLQPIDLDA